MRFRAPWCLTPSESPTVGDAAGDAGHVPIADHVHSFWVTVARTSGAQTAPLVGAVFVLGEAREGRVHEAWKRLEVVAALQHRADARRQALGPAGHVPEAE